MGRTKAQHSRENKERYNWYKERGICTTCGRVWVEPGHVRCKACEDKIKVYHDRDSEKRKERKAAQRQERIQPEMRVYWSAEWKKAKAMP